MRDPLLIAVEEVDGEHANARTLRTTRDAAVRAAALATSPGGAYDGWEAAVTP